MKPWIYSILIGIPLIVLAFIMSNTIRDKISNQPEEPRPCRNFEQGRVTINDTTWQVAVAASRDEQTQGLMECPTLPANSGMYFVYSEPQVRTFWMKNMQIPLDIVWISGDTVVGVERNVPPGVGEDADLPRYTSPAPVTAVLELAAGQAEQRGISKGTKMVFEKAKN